MKIRANTNSEQASALLITMLITAILTFLVSSYLILTSSQNQLVMRSLCWNTAIPVAEAGIEEGMAQLHQNYTNLAAEGWSQSGTNYSLTRFLGSNYYSVTIGTQGMMCTITSKGYAQRQGTNYLSRTVQVSAEIWSFTQVGLVANSINLGGDLKADSYDSSDPNFSTPSGQYDPTKASDKALIADSGLGFSMGGNSMVRGYVAGGSTLVTLSGSASVGDLSWNKKGAQLLPTPHDTNGYSLTAQNVQVPYTAAPPPVPGNIGGTNYNYVLSGGRYMAGNIDSAGLATTMVVTRPSALFVTNDLQLASITFLPGAHLNLYISMPSLAFNPTIIGGTAAQFTVLGLPTCTSMTMNSHTLFIGVIYAPQLNLNAQGGAEIDGAVLANSFSCNGNFFFHYDFATAKNWITDPVTVISWAEL